MIRHLLFASICIASISCNNDKKTSSDATTTENQTKETTGQPSSSQSAGASQFFYTVEGAEKNSAGSVLVQKDESKLSPGNDLFAMITANVSDTEGFTLNFLFTTKPSVYPVVGLSYTRNAANGQGQVFGGLLGGKPELTNYKVNLTECRDLGSNGLGGHKWAISGSVDEEVTIPAMGIMRTDKEHPESIKVSKIKFSNLTFDDNWEEMLEKALDKN